MKKALSLLLMLAVLMLAPPFAFAEEAEEEKADLPADLFDLWDYGDESPSWVSFAIPVSDGIVMAPIAVKDIPADQLAVTDGEHIWEAAAVLPDDLDQLALVFFSTKQAQSRRDAWQLLSWGDSVPASSCTVRFGDSLGSRINRGILASEEIHMNGQRFLLLDLTDPAPVGSPVLTGDGRMAGVVTAQWAEGVNRVLVMPADGVARSVGMVAGLITGLPEWGETPEGLTVSVEKNLVTIDWTDMALPEKTEGSDVYMVLVDTGNDYLTSFTAERDVRRVTLLLAPGRFYIVGPVVSEGRPSVLPKDYASFYLPKAEKLTEYGFKPIRTAIAEKRVGKITPVDEVTEELLRSGRAYFWSSSSYNVTEKIEGKTLLITLTDPEGNNYRYESGWMYDPSCMERDIWYLKLSEMGLTDSLDEKGWPKGVYRMAYYVDGDLGGELEFRLK